MLMLSSDNSETSSDYEDIGTSSDEEEEEVVNGPVSHEQWVQFIEFCSVKSESKESVSKGTGVEKLCQATDLNFGEQEKASAGWILNNNNTEECLIVSFTNSVFINEIYIYESLNPGSIVKLEMFDSHQDNWWIMWQRKTPPKKQSATPRIFKPILRRYRQQSNTIRITLDPRHTNQIGIQAIKLLGSNIFDTTLHRKSLFSAMNKLYDQALNHVNTDVQFRFNEKIINAHRNILCCRSVYFRSLLLNDFVEKTQTKPIELSDIDYETFLEILYFIYTGTYHSTISYERVLQTMIYANKIDLLSAKNAAMEHICRHLRSKHDSVVTIYCLARKMSPAFDILLDYIYDLCSECLTDISKQADFIELDKEYMIDIIRKSAERRDRHE